MNEPRKRTARKQLPFVPEPDPPARPGWVLPAAAGAGILGVALLLWLLLASGSASRKEESAPAPRPVAQPAPPPPAVAKAAAPGTSEKEVQDRVDAEVKRRMEELERSRPTAAPAEPQPEPPPPVAPLPAPPSSPQPPTPEKPLVTEPAPEAPEPAAATPAPPPAARRSLEPEPAVSPRPSGWEKVASDLNSAVSAKDGARAGTAAPLVAAWDSADSARRLVSAFVQSLKPLESMESQDQKLTRIIDDTLIRFILAAVKNPQSQETKTQMAQGNALLKEQGDLALKIGEQDAMVRAILDAMTSFRSAEAVQTILAQARTSFYPRYRARLIEACGRIRTPTAVAGIVDLLQKNSNEIVSLACTRALHLSELATPEAGRALAGGLRSEFWQVQVASARALGDLRCVDQFEALLDALKKSRGQRTVDLNEALRAMTGVDKHGNAAAWSEWWLAHKSEVLAGTYRPEPLEKAGAAGSTTFCGIPVHSNAVAFVIDASSSMLSPSPWLPPSDDEGYAMGLTLGGNTKAQVALFELKKVVLKLPEGSLFSLLLFEGNMHIYGSGPVRMTEDKRKAILEFLKIIRVGALTNLFGGLSKALSYAGDPSAPSLKKDGIDTIYVLTDGMPTVGIKETPKFLKRFSQMNEFTGVRVHTVHIGNDAEAETLLRGLADGSGGTYRGSGVRSAAARPPPGMTTRKGRGWSPEQATGAPDTMNAGDSSSAWASQTADGQDEWLQLDYAEPAIPKTIRIHETYNPGAVVRVSVFDATGKELTVWTGKDPTPAGTPMGTSEIPVSASIRTKRVKIYLDSKAVRGWNEIDAVGLVEATGRVQWATAATASSTYGQ